MAQWDKCKKNGHFTFIDFQHLVFNLTRLELNKTRFPHNNILFLNFIKCRVVQNIKMKTFMDKSLSVHLLTNSRVLNRLFYDFDSEIFVLSCNHVFYVLS